MIAIPFFISVATVLVSLFFLNMLSNGTLMEMVQMER
jgi:hypothetical protein